MDPAMSNKTILNFSVMCANKLPQERVYMENFFKCAQVFFKLIGEFNKVVEFRINS